ncbi:MAG TPA: acyltransferase [Catalimonadaceae bacterium]|nr:acyltransferase [Catalimonadaceae bacterium]
MILARLQTLVRSIRYLFYGKGISIHRSSKVHPSAQLKIVYAGRIQIGKGCQIHEGVLIKSYGGSIEIGDNVSLNAYCIAYGHGGLKIGDNCRIAAQTVFIPSNHKFDRTDIPINDQGLSLEGIVVEEDVWIGTGVKVLDGVTIRKGCVIAAGSVVNKSTEAYGVYAGIPARLVKSRLTDKATE